MEREGVIQIAEAYARKRGQTVDAWTEGLPHVCRKLALDSKKCSPLWGGEDKEGVTADFVRGVAWLLAQDIYTFPRTFSEVSAIERIQLKGEKIIQNDTRWPGLRFWARYLGFATGDERS